MEINSESAFSSIDILLYLLSGPLCINVRLFPYKADHGIKLVFGCQTVDLIDIEHQPPSS